MQRDRMVSSIDQMYRSRRLVDRTEASEKALIRTRAAVQPILISDSDVLPCILHASVCYIDKCWVRTLVRQLAAGLLIRVCSA